MTRLATRLALLLLAAAALSATAAAAKTSWVSVRDLEGAGSACLASGGRRFDYAALGAGDAAACVIHGPRRLKIVSRYLFADGDPDRVPYTVVVTVDGREVLRKSFTGKPHDGVSVCDGDPRRVGSLRRSYVSLPSGRHDLEIRAFGAGHGEVAMRLFRQVKRTRQRWVTFAPESYGEVRRLLFESGHQSTYYHFDAVSPLCFAVAGPTELRVGSRLDFDHTMNGSQTYALEVSIDDAVWRTFHFDAAKLSTAVYVDRPDILPGGRREFRITVPRGRHRVEIRCVRPEACGIAAMVHIPRSDLER